MKKLLFLSLTFISFIGFSDIVKIPLSDPSLGYEVRGLGDEIEDIAVVFTNHLKTATWVAPKNLRNVSFLVVGGGGGGGGDRLSDATEGGAGGGGGGVVTGIVYKISKGDEISVVVGAGGVGGVTSGKYANGIWSGSSGGNSSFSVGGVNYVTAIGGGGDGGFRMPGKVGGSSAGSRSDKANDTTLSPSPVQPLINTNGISFYESFGSKGGDALNSCFYASAGGGGACNPGSSPISHYRAGDGGEGLRCAITGEMLVYGSGGGGGSSVVSIQAKGGTGAGDGNEFRNDESAAINGDGLSALANLGGGGGGGGGERANGGNGGSGIVVLRYSVVKPGIKFFFK